MRTYLPFPGALRRGVLACSLLAGLWAAPLLAQETPPAAGEPKGPTAKDLVALGDALAPSFVRVEYTVQYDKGEAPGTSRSWGGRFSEAWSSGSYYEDWEQLIKEERPAERAGYVLSDRRIITSDPMVHPRFIKEINVRVGDQLLKATPVAYVKAQGAWVLEVQEPLKGVTPLAFDGNKDGPYLWATYSLDDDAWGVHVGSSGGQSSVSAQRHATVGSGEGLIIDRKGRPVALSFGADLPVDGSWKCSPETWPMIGAPEMAAMLRGVEKASDDGIVRVALRFRSPRGGGAESPYGRFMHGMDQGDEQSITEWNGSGLLVDDKTVVVIANLKPKVTGRLEEVRIFSPNTPPDGAVAKFAGTMADYGCFLAKLDSPLSGAVQFADGPVTSLRDQLLLRAEITVAGEVRTGYYWRDRIMGMGLGWHRQVIPAVGASRSPSSYFRYGYNQGASSAPGSFIFTPDAKLAVVPIAKRQKVAVEERSYGWDPYSDSGVMSVTYLREALAQSDKRLDSENRPLSEEEENRLAWIGVEMQAMDPDLARANKVVDQTSGGSTGGIVTYVYDNSPAAKAGVQVGDILLRVRVQGQPKPIEVQLDGTNGMEGMMDQMFANLDRVPEEYLDQLPKPWGSAENSLTRALTDIGFGTPFVAEIFRDGKVVAQPMTIEQGPDYFDSAKRFKSDAAGLTTRDLTYEVRRFFQLKPEDAGIIISKVEKGEKASVAGLKPYEIITAVNDQPIKSAADFEKAIAPGGEFRLNVKRMTVGRIVKLKLGGAKDAKDAKADDAKPAPESP